MTVDCIRDMRRLWNKNKIFQSFFLQINGQGTGLGLCLGDDIIKAHNGDVKVETKEDEGSVSLLNYHYFEE